MPSYELIQNCTVDDGAGIVKSNISSRWDTPWWRLYWGSRSYDEVVAAHLMRVSWSLLKTREKCRHQKIIVPETGQIVGYARWIMPEGFTNEWTQAQLPDVGKAVTEQAREDWDANPIVYRAEIQKKFNEVEDDLKERNGKAPYLRKITPITKDSYGGHLC